MTTDNRLINHIIQSGEQQSEDIKKEAEKTAEAILEKARAEAEANAAEIAAATENAAVRLKKSALSNASLISRNEILKTKRDEIDRTIEGIVEYICNLDDESYFSVLYSLAKNTDLKKGEVLFNKKDLGRLPKDFTEKMRSAGLEVTVGKEPVDIIGGFILRDGLIEVNCAVDAVVEERRSALEDFINASLFRQGE